MKDQMNKELEAKSKKQREIAGHIAAAGTHFLSLKIGELWQLKKEIAAAGPLPEEYDRLQGAIVTYRDLHDSPCFYAANHLLLNSCRCFGQWQRTGEGARIIAGNDELKKIFATNTEAMILSGLTY